MVDMGASSKQLVKDLARPALRPLLARIEELRRRIDTLETRHQELQAVPQQLQAVGQQLQALGQQSQALVRQSKASSQQLRTNQELYGAEAERTSVIEARIGEVERQHAAIRSTLDEFLDAINRQNALARETRREQQAHELTRQQNQRETWDTLERLTQNQSDTWDTQEGLTQNQRETWETLTRLAEGQARLEGRLEFVRKEVMLEVQGGSTPGDIEVQEPRIVDYDKFEARPLRLNLGCGHLPVEGFVNVDSRALPGVDVVAEVGRLPVNPAEAAEIRSAHLLEHFPQTRLTELLGYWFDLLQPGGLFVAIVPDAESMLKGFMSGEISWEDFKEVTFGGQEYTGDYHFTMFSQSDLTETLNAAGFVDVKIAGAGRRNGACLEMEAVAHKPGVD